MVPEAIVPTNFPNTSGNKWDFVPPFHHEVAACVPYLWYQSIHALLDMMSCVPDLELWVWLHIPGRQMKCLPDNLTRRLTAGQVNATVHKVF